MSAFYTVIEALSFLKAVFFEKHFFKEFFLEDIFFEELSFNAWLKRALF